MHLATGTGWGDDTGMKRLAYLMILAACGEATVSGSCDLSRYDALVGQDAAVLSQQSGDFRRDRKRGCLDRWHHRAADDRVPRRGWQHPQFRMRLSARLIGLATLTACTVTEPTAPIPPTLEDTCNARQYANLIGDDATALEKVLILGQVRVIRPGDVVTQDFRPERINFGIDGANRIIDVSCG